MTAIVPKSPALIAGEIFVLVMTLVAIFAPLLAPHDPTVISMLEARIAPVPFGDNWTWTHPLGTDIMGRDMLSRLIYGHRIAVFLVCWPFY